MRLHDLVNQGQAEAGAALKIGLEGFEDFFDLLRAHAEAGIGESHLPIVSDGFNGDGECAAIRGAFHGANRVLTKIPEHLFKLVAVRHGQSLVRRKTTLDPDSSLLRRHAVFHQRQGVVDQLNEIDLVEVILLGARVSQEVGNDAVQTL